MCIEELQEWFAQHVTINGAKYELDYEQAAVVLDEHQNAIVTARAGSGKTYTIIAKIIYLVALKHVDPTHILALGFYREPQDDFNRRLSAVKVDGFSIFRDGNIARTFHSLACGITKVKGSILMDSKDNQEYHLTKYIGSIVKDRVDTRRIYGFIRDESYEPKIENYATEEDYKLARKYTKYETLAGERVKSRGEKIIADYLFEHDLAYGYEKVSFYPYKLAKYAVDDESAARLKEKDKLNPDFVLNDYDTVWEHWAIRGDEDQSEIAEIDESGVIGTYQEYLDNMEFKQWFYGKTWLDPDKIATDEAEEDEVLQKFLSFRHFISTHYQKDQSREEFEEFLGDFLAEQDIYADKLSMEELLSKFRAVDINNSRTAERVQQFIKRAEQQFPHDFAGLKSACLKETEQQTKLFYEVALTAYDYYLQDLTADPSLGQRDLINTLFPGKIYTTDQSLNLADAVQVLNDGAYNVDDPLHLMELEYIFLDEYQDFSLLFHNLVRAILNLNPKINVLAVGDDWQAISGFAGASLEYFDHFEQYFPGDTTRLRLSTNRRSVASIVEISNTFMLHSLGDTHGTVALHPDNDSEVLNECVLGDIRNSVRIDSEDHSNNYKKYSILLGEIVKDNRGKTIKCLSRTNKLKFGDGETKNIKSYKTEFVCRYRKFLSLFEPNRQIDFATVNSSKGLESDIVVIMESDSGRFPIFHPDNHLYKVFGETEQAALDEQKRLFYVAITRAKEKIYIVHDKDMAPSERKERNFLTMLDLDKFKRYYKDEFLPLYKKIQRGLVNHFVAIRVEMKPNRYNHQNTDIVAVSAGGEKVTQFDAFPDGASVTQLKRYIRECTKDHPMSIKATHSKPYGEKIYIKFFDPQAR